jgi:hypothetical protein
MSATVKRKARRGRRRPDSTRRFGPSFFAPIIGEDPREMHRFFLLDIWRPLPLPDPDQDVYLREV